MSIRNTRTLLSLTTLATLSLAQASLAAPIAVTGYNKDIVYSAGETLSGTSAFDTSNNYALYSASQNATGGLPTGGSITSATGSGFSYQLGSYTASNVLLMSQAGNASLPSTGTLTFSTPAAYSSLGFLTASTNGGDYGTGTIKYNDGTSAAFSYNAPDWYGTDQAAVEGRVNLGSGAYDQTGPGLGETIINVDPTRQVASVTFNMPSITDAGAATGIFAVSGNQTTAATVLTNGGFESGIAGWNLDAVPGYSFAAGDNARTGTGSFYFGSLGTQPGHLSQVVATQVGKSYTLTFYAKTGNGSSETPNNLAISFGGTQVASFALPVSPNYTQYTYNVTATSGSSLLLFTGSNDPDATYLDDISLVAAAPEPSQTAAYGLGVLGLAGLAFKARKRRQVA